MQTLRRGVRVGTLAAAVSLMVTGIAACEGGSGASGGTTTMNVENFAGDLGATIADIGKGFEQKYNVHINWVEGSGVQNVARIAASVGHQQYDAAFVPEQSLVQGTQKGYWAKLDHSLVATSDVYPALLASADDGAPVGMITTDLFYNTDTFQKNNWSPPKAFADLLDPKYCNKIGILDSNQTYGLYTVLGLGGLTAAQAKSGDLAGAWKTGLEKLASIKNCLPTIESSGGALEQKIQTGRYVIGTHGSVRILPLAKAGAPVKAVLPKEGAFLTTSFVAPVKDAPHPKLAQEFTNWYLSNSAQSALMNKAFYGPTVSTVTVPPDLKAQGVPDKETVSKLIVPDPATVAKNRSDWHDQFQRALA